MRRFLGLVLIALLLIPASAGAFDGFRKGFVLGGGVGFTPLASWSFEVGSTTYDESKAGVGFHLIIGYAWDELNMIVYEGNVAAYKSDFINIISDGWAVYELSAGQGFNGASWYHYFGPKGKTFFSTVGLGFYIFQLESHGESAETDPGIGLLVGGGYEFTPHVQAGLYLSPGQTSDPLLGDFSHAHISILISAVAF